MLRKVFKNLSYLGLLFLLVGIACVLPSFVNRQTKQNQTQLQVVSASPENENWLDEVTVQSASSSDIQSGVFYGQNVYFIYTAVGLANVAYNINSNQAGYSTATYVLANNINLEGAFWTPIGTGLYPFSGVFLGEGHTISNISMEFTFVDDNGTSGEGLFGNTNGATISDLILSGKFSIFGAYSTHTGNLIGRAVNTSIIACRDNMESSYKSIGTVSGTVQVFRSTAYAVTNISNGNITSVSVTDTSSLGTIDGTGITFAGYAVYYYDTNTLFYINNLIVNDGNGTRLRVIVDTSFNDYTGTFVKSNPLYSVTHKMIRRENLALTDTTIPYSLRPGYRPTYQNPSASDCYINITFEQANVSVTFNMGYGTRQNLSTSIPYDTTVQSFFNSAQGQGYNERLGYTLENVTTSRGNISNNPAFYYAYPLAGGTINLSWIAGNNKSFDFRFLLENEDFEIGGFNYSNLSSALTNTAGVYGSHPDVSGGTLDTSRIDEKVYRVNNIVPGNDVTISFMLDVGYEIGVISGTNSVVIDGDDSSNSYISNSDFVYKTSNGNPASGIYLNFANFTGTDGQPYTVIGKNNDSYNEVSAVGTVVNESGYGDLDIRERRIYTITISNIVGTTGNIFFVVKRASQDMNVVTNVYALNDADYNSFTWIYNGKWEFGSATTTKARQFTIEARLGQNININIEIDAKSGYYVLSHDTGTSSIKFDANGNESGNSTTINNKTYYQKVSFNGVITSLADGLTLTVNIGGFNVRFRYEVGTMTGETFSPIVYDEDDNTTKGISGEVNNTKDIGLNSDSIAPIRDSAGNNTDYISITTNGFYTPVRLIVQKRNDDGSLENVVNMGTDYTNYFTVSDDGLTYTYSPLSASANILNILYDGDKEVDFVIRFIVEDTLYSLGWENFKFNIFSGTNSTTYNGKDNKDFLDDLFTLTFLSDSQVSKTSFKPRENGKVILNLTDLGRSILYGNTSNFTPQSINISNGIDKDGFEKIKVNSTDFSQADIGQWSFDFTAGTYNFEFAFNFTYKQVNLLANGLVSSDGYRLIDTNDDLFIGNSGIYTYNYSYQDGKGLVSLVGAQDFASVQIHTQYYLLGWYLQNGNVVSQTNYNGIYQDGNLVAGYQNLTSANNSSLFNIDVFAIVEQRTVTVSYNAGEVGKGEFVIGDDSEETLTYGEIITLKTPFRNKGYTFDVWSYTIKTSSLTAEKGAQFSITNLNWSNLFDSNSLLQTWSGFVDRENEGQQNSQKSSLTLTANWNIINYNLFIDGSISKVGVLQRGDEIRYISNSQKNGGGTYYIYRDGVKVYEILGGTINGYISSSFTALFNGQVNAQNFDGYVGITFTGTVFDTLMTDDFDSLETILINTVRYEAPYKVYIEKSDYFNVNILLQGENYGEDEKGVYVVVTYNKVPTTLDKNSSDFLFKENGAIAITRNGYDFSGDFYNFDPTSEYLYLQDITVSPIWTRNSEATSEANIEFCEDVNIQNPTFYLLNSHDVVQGSIIDYNQDLLLTTDDETIYFTGANEILSNGDKITSYGFVVVHNGTSNTFENIVKFNINNLYEDGSYDIYFYINLIDSLYNTSEDTLYTLKTSTLTFNMHKNDFTFTGNFVSAYNGTNEFVPTLIEDGYTLVNNYGSVYLTYDWNGGQEVNPTEFNVTNFFRSYLIGGNDFNVGEDKEFLLTINNSYFSAVTSINGVIVNTSTNWANLIENILDEKGSYTYSYLNGLTIVRARFVIDFGTCSTYYFDGVTLIVYTHDKNAVPFQIGKEYFEWNLDRIIYNGGEVETDTVFTGKDDNSVFTVEGLTVDGKDYIGDMDTSFEYVLDGKFTLYNSDSALKLNYSTRYLTATNGVLDSSLAVDYAGISDNLYIGNVIAGGENVEISDSQFTYQIEDNVLFSIVNNGTTNLQIYINRSMLNHGLSYRIYIDITNERLAHLTPLAWGESTISSDYESFLDTDFVDPSTGSDPYQEFNILSSMSDVTTYAVLTDVVKLSFNYNGGHNSQNNSSEIIYLSYSDGEYTLSNPTFDYVGLDFDGYSYSSSDISLIENTDSTIFTNIDGAQSVSLVAYWKLNEIEYTKEKVEFDYFASLSSLELDVKNVISYASLVGGTYTFTITKNDDNSVVFVATDDIFTIMDETQRAPITLDGDYTFNITLSYTNSFQGEQIIEREFDITINVSLNTIGIIDATNPPLTFNNADRKNDIILSLRKNALIVENLSLNDMISRGLTDYGMDTSISQNSIVTTEIINAGIYHITISLNENYVNFFKLETGYNIVTIEIAKYQFDLQDYSDQIDIFKLIGQDDPNPITDTITITKDMAVSDEVEINFTRESGEGVGSYEYLTATLTNAIDRTNYSLVFNGIDSKFEIRVPDSNLQVRLNGNLEYIYNGYPLSSISARYSQENSRFEIYGMAGQEEVSQSFNLFYTSGGREIEIPLSQRDLYASYLAFTIENVSKNVGSYTFNISLSQIGEQTDWPGVEFTQDTLNNKYNQIIVSKRTITVTNATKVFDQSVQFVYTNNLQNQTVDLTITNIVDGDTVTVNGRTASELVGQRAITSISLDEISDANYTIVCSQLMVITPSQENVITTTEINSLVYGAFSQGDNVSQVLLDVPLMFENQSGVTINNIYIEITNYNFTNPSYSTGHFLEVGNRNIQFTLTSTNYTFGQDVGEIGKSYTMQVDFDVEITPLAITIENSSHPITKVYDGDNLIDSANLNQNVNASLSPYISSGLLAGDIITITSGEYDNKEIGNNKQITLLNFSQNDDSSNYKITYPNLVGSITNIILTFNKDYNTFDFVDDGQGFTNTNAISVVFTGNVDNDIIDTLLLEENFVVRRGYTQIGWTYQGIEVSSSMTNKDAFLQDAVNSGVTGITLQVIWKINEYQISIVTNQSTISPNITSVTREYYSSLNDGLITVTANEGYTFEGVSLSADNGVIVENVDSTNIGTFNITNIIGNMTVTINTEEIQIRIMVDYNNPEGYSVSTDTLNWINNNNRIMSYSQLLAEDLPNIDVDQLHTYDFDYWTINGERSTQNNIWDRIKEYLSSAPIQDNLVGFTFVANWIEEQVTLTINDGANADITVYNGTISDDNIVLGQGGIYNVTYNDNLIIDIKGEDWYKWTTLTIGKEQTSLAGDTSPTNKTDGQFSFQIKGMLALTISMEEIEVQITTTYITPLESTVNETEGYLDDIYTISDGDSVSIRDFIGVYTATVGTYYQSAWSNGENKFDLTDKVKDIITSLIGIPTMDSTITLDAVWQGETYTLSFVKNNNNAIWQENINIDEENQEVITREYVYGDILTKLPVPFEDGMYYTWLNEYRESIEEGQNFTTLYPNSSLEMTYTANWDNITYFVAVVYDGVVNADKILGVTYALTGESYPSGGTNNETAYYGQNRDFVFNLAEGYEIDLANTTANNPELVTLSRFGNSYTLRLGNIKGDVVVTVAIKAKDYTISIEMSQYETISETVLNVSYDQNILSMFNAIEFERTGYKIGYLYDGDNLFATYNGLWIFSENYVENNLYKTDSNLTLKPIYKANGDYLNISTTEINGLIFNGDLQNLAKSSVNSLNNETSFVEGVTLANGDEVVEFFYTLNGERLASQANFDLYHRNAVINGELTFTMVLKDSLSLNREQTYSYTGESTFVTLSKSDILTDGANLISYYSGSKSFYPSEELGEENEYGTLIYQYGNAVNELTLNRVEFIDDNGLYDVGEDYKIVYYLQVNGQEFNVNNYNNLVKDEYSNLYIYTVKDITAKIIPAIVTLEFDEQGFYNGYAQYVTGDVNIILQDFNTRFTVTLHSLLTVSEDVGLYSTQQQFVIDSDITLLGQDKESNFVYFISGGYEIVGNSGSYQIVTGAKYLDVDKQTVEDMTSLNTTVTAFNFSGTTISISGESFNYMVSGELIFSITANGTYKPVIIVAQNKEVSFTFSVDGTIGVLDWVSSTNISSLINTLNGLKNEDSRSITQLFTQQSNFYPVVTDYKAVFMNLGDKGDNQGYLYVKLGSYKTANVPVWTGFNFLSWSTLGSSVTSEGNDIFAGLNAGITTTTITAIWEIALPIADVVAQDDTIVRGAKVEFNAVADEITVENIIGQNGIENENTQALNYSYSWLKDGSIYGMGSSFTVPANTTSNGQYTLSIIASRSGYASKSISLTFNISITRLDIGDISINQTEFIYSNTNYLSSINFTIGDIGHVELEEILNVQSSSNFYFTLSGTSSEEIRQAGEYTLTLGLNETVFYSSAYQETVNVAKYNYTITNADIPSELESKYFGLGDPTFSFTKTMFESGNREDIEITLTREKGETVGEYDFNSVATTNLNYNLTITDAKFTIKQSDFTLEIVVDSPLTITYNGQAPLFNVNYDENQQKWIISTSESNSTISLYTLENNQRQDLSSELYKLALENITFAYPSAINAGTYNLANMTVEKGGNANFNKTVTSGQLTIDKLGLIINSVTKVFDRTYDINPDGVVFANLVEGDNVILSGQYNSLLANNDITLSNLLLRGNSYGDDSGNYYISNPEITGSITPLAINTVSLNLVNSNFTYGQIAKGTDINQIVLLANGANLTLDGVSTDLANGYIAFSMFRVEDTYLSSSNYLKATNVSIKVTMTSQNFTFGGQNSVTVDITLNISPKELDLSGLSNLIVKDYDETNLLPGELSNDISAYGILQGDIVYIDKALSHYQDENIGKNKKVIIILGGGDCENYSVKDNVLGTINAYTVYFTVNATTQHPLLVTDGKFVDDGQTPIVKDNFFKFVFPNDYSGEELLAQLNYPTRKGYTAVGWMIKQGDSYIALTKDNINQIIENVVYDETNEDNTIEIYTVWEIKDFAVSVVGNGINDFTIIGDYFNNETSLVRYYSSIQVDVTANYGYKIARYTVNGDYASANIDNVGENSGSMSVENIGSNIEIIVSMEEIQISIIVDTNIPDYTSRTDSENTYLTYNYSDLSGMFEEDLPSLQVTQGTYVLDGYQYIKGTDIDVQSLQEIVDLLIPDLNQDSEITLFASWVGVPYVVYFDAGEGTLSGTNPINAVYGSALANVLPSASLAGRSFVWVDDFGVTYAGGDIFHTIGNYVDNNWTTTLQAQYINNPYTLTVLFGERISVYENNQKLSNGATFTIVYNEDRLILNVQPDQGYDFVLVSDNLNGQFEKTENGVEIYNLTQDGTITINSTPAVNVMTLNNSHVGSYEVFVDEMLQEMQTSYNVYTESTVRMIFNADKGYEFDDNSLTYVSQTSSSIDYTISQDNKTLTVVWKDFIDDITFNIQAIPSLNTITIDDISDRYISIEFNGVSVNVTGGTFDIRSDVDLIVNATLKYGYMGGEVQSSVDEFLISQSCTYSRADGYYHLTANFDNINESFAISFTSTEREYIFSLEVPAGQEEQGTVTVKTPQNVLYGEELILGATNLKDEYIFAGWEFDGQIIAQEAETKLTINSSFRNMLESVPAGGTIIVYATFKDRVSPISFTAGNRGQITFYQNEEQKTTVNGGRTVVAELILALNVKVLIEPDEGYELDQILINGVSSTEGYDSETGILTVMLDPISPISSIEVTFKASDAYVHIQGILQVNFEFIYGTDAGGYIYLVDEQGNRLGDENYIDGQDSMYYDYRVLSKTDSVFYLMAEPRSGFNVVLNSPTQGVVISEITSAGGNIIYAVSGVKDGAQVQAIFSARENQIDIQFVMNGSNQVVKAGQIYVDTSSVYVKASQNNSENVHVSAITGAELNITINSLFTYELVDNDGQLKVQINYLDGMFDDNSVTVGQVVETDPYANGFTMSSTLNIKNVNADAVIYIYVQPKIYNLVFYVTEDIQVTMPSSVVYGQTFSLDSLTDEQKAKVFSTRDGYTLGGYYTMQTGRGTQYIDSMGTVVRPWNETGYSWTGYGYEPTANYDSQTETFTLYASWIYDRATISITFRPVGLEEGLYNVSIENVITNLGDTSYWIGQDDAWYTEVKAGSSLRLQAYNYEGYEFAYWLVTYNGEQPTQHPANFDMSFEVGKYDIRAVYQPKFTLTDTKGGRSELVQDGVVVTGQSFSSEQLVTLKAYPNDGYKFVYFVNTDTNEIYCGNYDESTNSYIYTFAELLSSPLNVQVIFEGKPVTINIDDSEIEGIHSIVGVYIDNKNVDFATPINATIGQTLKIIIDKGYGYEINIDGANLTQTVNNNSGYYEYTFELSAEELTAQAQNYVLNLKFGASRQNINLTFEMGIYDAVSASEIVRAGYLTFIDANGETVNFTSTTTYQIIYGDLVALKAYVLSNYVLSDVVVDNGEYELSILSLLVDNQLTINKQFLDRYLEYNLTIRFVYSRLLWTDDDSRANVLVGNGTEESPYFIRNASELAFVAYAVNSGLTNNDGVLYSEAVYQLVANINLSGRFWVPIGTHENPFNGTMHLDSYEITGLNLYKNYSNPDTSYGGLFWVLGDNARITQDTTTLVIVLSIVGAIILLIILILLLLYYIRKRRKKMIDDIANN